MATILETSQDGLHSYYISKIEELQIANRDKALNLERLKVCQPVLLAKNMFTPLMRHAACMQRCGHVRGHGMACSWEAGLIFQQNV
jgi:hypothetical protein